MAAKLTSKPFLVLLIVACMAMLVPMGLAQAPQASLVVPLNGHLPEVSEKDIMQCWSSLTNIEGCMLEIYRSLFRGQIGTIGFDCCHAITAINENCWPTMFPYNPFFPPFLKSYCAGSGGSSPWVWSSTSLIGFFFSFFDSLFKLLASRRKIGLWWYLLL